MDYYGFTAEQYNRVLACLNQVSITGINQIDTFYEATSILKQPTILKVKEGEDKNGKEIC